MAERAGPMPLVVKLKLLMYIPAILFSAVLHIVVLLFSPGPRRPLKRVIVASLSRSSALILGPLTSKYTGFQASTADGIRKYCNARKIAMHSVDIPIHRQNSDTDVVSVPGATLHLLSTKTTGTRIVLYFHGGGYVSPAVGQSHVPFAMTLAAATKASTLAILEYGLAPELRYPGQLVQGIEALRYLLQPDAAGGMSKATSDIILIGDSAGANLVAGVLAHLYWTSPYTDSLGIVGRIGGAVLISPWVGHDFQGGSYVSNTRNDTIDVKAMIAAKERWSPVRDDIWADMLGGKTPVGQSKESFWGNVCRSHQRVVEKIILTAGEDELFLDDIVTFAALLGAEREAANTGQQTTATFIRSSGETHCGAMLDAIAGVHEKHSMLSDLLAWLEKI